MIRLALISVLSLLIPLCTLAVEKIGGDKGWSVQYDAKNGTARFLYDGKAVMEDVKAWATVQGQVFQAAGRTVVDTREVIDGLGQGTALQIEHYTYKYRIRRIFTIYPANDFFTMYVEVESGDGRIAIERIGIIDSTVSQEYRKGTSLEGITIEALPDPLWETVIGLEAENGKFSIFGLPEASEFTRPKAVESEIVRSSMVKITKTAPDIR